MACRAFQIPAGTREMMVVPETWKVELPSGEILASRVQVKTNAIITNISSGLSDTTISCHLSLHGLCPFTSPGTNIRSC